MTYVGVPHLVLAKKSLMRLRLRCVLCFPVCGKLNTTRSNKMRFFFSFPSLAPAPALAPSPPLPSKVSSSLVASTECTTCDSKTARTFSRWLVMGRKPRFTTISSCPPSRLFLHSCAHFQKTYIPTSILFFVAEPIATDREGTLARALPPLPPWAATEVVL